MKIFSWLFNVRFRHSRGIRKYKNGGVGRCAYSLIVHGLMSGVSILLCWWLYYFVTSAIGGSGAELPVLSTVGIGALAFIFVVTTLEFNLVFGILALRCAAKGREIKRAEGESLPLYQDEQVLAQKKKLKIWDIVVGVLLLVFAVAVLALAILFVYQTVTSIDAFLRSL